MSVYSDASSRRSRRSASSRTESIFSELENAPNPFTMPSDEEVFKLREEEHKRKQIEREQQAKLRVHEKTTWSTRQNSMVGVGKSRDDSFDMSDDESVAETPAHQGKIMSRAPKDKELMSDFIAKKREMFLVQMSLNTKREEIYKLEQRAAARDMALAESEQMLDHDRERFENFITENDSRAMDAIKRAEVETAARNERVAEIKKLNLEIRRVETETAKCEEKLAECITYQQFLLECTPDDWYAERKVELQMARAEEILSAQEKAEAEAKAAAAAAAAAAAEEGIEPEPEPEPAKGKGKKTEKPPPEVPREEKLKAIAATIEIPDAEMPMYYMQPVQLTQYFSRMEEDNLFLMQRCQETEVMFEEIKAKHDEKEGSMNDQCSALKEQIGSLKGQITTEKRKCDALAAKMKKEEALAENEESEKQEREQTAAIAKVFELCENPDPDLKAIMMLTRIERKLEQTFAALEPSKFPPAEFERAYKAKVKARRRRERTVGQAKQKELQAQRIEESLRKATEPIRKKTGKQIMFRSAPPRRRQKRLDNDDEFDQEADDIKYFGVSLGKS